MLSQQDLFFFLTVLSRGANASQLVDACARCAQQPDGDLPTLLIRQGVLDQGQVDDALQALQSCLERNHWSKEAALDELARSIGPVRLEACWEAVSALGRFAEPRQDSERYGERRLHAEGGLGRVWRAHDQRMGRVVALKDLRPELGQRPPVLWRFIQEARITSQLEHPNIIPIYDLYHDQGRPPFYTMKFISGRTLQDALELFHAAPAAGRWSSLEFHKLLSIFAQVCEAIAYAHSRGVIHRDLKPANVALGEFNAVMVIDWGLARRLDEAEIPTDEGLVEGRLDQTRAGDVLGTPAYMAPEQAEGAVERIGPATDVYGLGAMLYAILTGQPPHPEQAGETAPEYLKRIASTATPPAQAPPPLAAMAARAMAQRPGDRYPSAADIAADVNRWLAGQAVSAHREGWPQRLARWMRQHPAWTQAAASIALLLMVAASVLITNSWAAERTLQAVGRANLEQEARSLDEIYQSRLDDFAERARVIAQLPVLTEVLARPADPANQRVEDLFQAACRLKPEYLEIAVVRRQPWTHVVQLSRSQPGEATLRTVTDQPVTASAEIQFLNDCAKLAPGEVHSVIVPPRQAGLSALLWIGAKVPGQEAGVFVLAADLQRLLQTPESTGLGGGYIHVADAKGLLLTKPIAGEARPAVGLAAARHPELAPYFASQPLPEAGFFHISGEAPQLTACRRLVAASSPAPLDLALLVERPLGAEVEESARGYRFVMVLTTLVIVAALALTYGLVRLLARGLAGR